jgi:circadian clock protein KaiC
MNNNVFLKDVVIEPNFLYCHSQDIVMAIRMTSGIPGFDKLIGGGYERGSVVLVSGGPGTGKTTFCLQFVNEGMVNKENSLYITFEELKEDILRDAASFGWNFSAAEKAKRVMIQYYSPFEFEKFLNELEDMITKNDIKRLVIDSTSVFGLYLKDPYEVRKKIWEISTLVKRWGCTALITSEIEGLTDIQSADKERPVSRFGVEEFVSDAVVILHYAALGGEWDRAIQVIKMRRTDHKKGVYSMKMDVTGIKVNPRAQI